MIASTIQFAKSARIVPKKRYAMTAGRHAAHLGSQSAEFSGTVHSGRYGSAAIPNKERKRISVGAKTIWMSESEGGVPSPRVSSRMERNKFSARRVGAGPV